ncbi:MAG: VWA domain-containing protein, partial [Tidjanibacter sp.]|nr:VWA domain-containing protein [Tidjanibacter sp.]
IDVSNSMLANDFEPSRLERTKYAVGRVIEGLSEDKIGVIVFAGDAYVQLPITADYLTAKNFVQQISPSQVTKQGTAIGAAIDMAAGSFSSQSESSRVLVLVTDGENHEDDALVAAERAAQQGITIYTIGIGTPEGAPIRIGDDFIRDSEGEIVVSKLDEEGLQKIALTTGGAYVRASAQSVGLDEIIKLINQTEKAKFESEVFEEYDEQYAVPVIVALVLLVLEFFVLQRKNRLLARVRLFGEEK